MAFPQTLPWQQGKSALLVLSPGHHPGSQLFPGLGEWDTVTLCMGWS
jgi:hypothetical protein